MASGGGFMDVERLRKIRDTAEKRLNQLAERESRLAKRYGEYDSSVYADLQAVKAEVAHARVEFEKAHSAWLAAAAAKR